jgi:CRISPR-associated protein Csm5
MRYRLTCLTPLLVGDGNRLSPIDYMVWKDHVNVLDQHRIFNLLAKGPRLESYLTQLRRADKLDFASWGGFAQNFADRRVPFEHPSSTSHWQRATGDSLRIPTFFAGPAGPYLPGSALKGALRTGLVFAGLNTGTLGRVAAQFRGERPPKRPAESAEDEIIGSGGKCRMRVIRAFDSKPVPPSSMKIYLLRVSTLVGRGTDRYELGWKQSPRGTVDGKRLADSTPMFAEMAAPGVVFEGDWQENAFLSQPEVHRSLGWRGPASRAHIFGAANQYAASLLAAHKQYAEWVGLAALAKNTTELQTRLEGIGASDDACLLSMGWGAGLLGKVAWLKTEDEAYREIIRQTPLYGRSISPSLPFPKTRRIVFLEDRPATLPGFALLEVLPS